MTRQTSESASGSVGSYITGFVFSLVLTMAAYLLVLRHVNSHHTAYSHTFLMAAVAALAIIQLAVQLVFFLHMSHESKPRWNLTVMMFALLVLFIIVFGSLWIMSNLSYHAGSPSETETHIIQDEGFRR